MSELSKSDLKVLQLFAQKSEELQTGILRHVPKKTTISYKVDEEIKIEGKIDPIVEKGLVVLAREFLDKHETVAFIRVVNIVSKYYRSDEEKQSRLKEYKRAWNKVFDRNPLFSIGPVENPLTNRELFDMVAYSNHIHTDISKDTERFAKYESIIKSWVGPIAEIQLHSMLINIQRLTQLLRIDYVDAMIKHHDY